MIADIFCAWGDGPDVGINYSGLNGEQLFVDLTSTEARAMAAQLITCAAEAEWFEDLYARDCGFDEEEPTQEIRTPVRSVYLIGSLRNPNIPAIASVLRAAGFEVFDDWFAAGPGADDAWRDYERQRGRTYREALDGHAAQHVFRFDKEHLDRCDAALLVLPAGKSGFAELAYTAGRGKPAYVLINEGDEPERWDVMAAFATDVFGSVSEAIKGLGGA